MKKSDQKFVNEWAKTRELGRVKYALMHGSIFGILMFIFMSVVELFAHSFAEAFLSKTAVFRLISFLVVSVLGFGTLNWSMNQYLYRNRTKVK